MKTLDDQSERLASGACLEQIADLQCAVLNALLSLGDGSLDELEDSLWRQQVLCATLQQSLEGLQSGTMDPAGVDRIISALHALHALNQTYTAAIGQARATTELLSKLSEAFHGRRTGSIDKEIVLYGERSCLCTA